MHAGALGVWLTSVKNDACVVEIPLDVNVLLRVGVFASDSYNFDQSVDIGTDYIIIEQRFQLKLIVDLAGDLFKYSSESLINRMEIGDSKMDILLNDSHLGTHWNTTPSGFDDMPF